MVPKVGIGKLRSRMVLTYLTAHETRNSHDQDVNLPEGSPDLEPAKSIVLLTLRDSTICTQCAFDIALLFLSQKVGISGRARE